MTPSTARDHWIRFETGAQASFCTRECLLDWATYTSTPFLEGQPDDAGGWCQHCAWCGYQVVRPRGCLRHGLAGCPATSYLARYDARDWVLAFLVESRLPEVPAGALEWVDEMGSHAALGPDQLARQVWRLRDTWQSRE